MQFSPDGNLYLLLIYSLNFLFFTQLQTAFIIGTSYAIAKLAPKRVLLEKSIVNRVLDIQKLKENEKQHVFALLDAFIKQTKFQSIMS